MYDYKYLNGPILAGSYQNWVIQSALASLRGLEARENWVYRILNVLKYEYTTMTKYCRQPMYCIGRVWNVKCMQSSSMKLDY